MSSNSEYTEKQMNEMYAFIQEYVEPEKRVEALKVLKGLMRYDRALIKQRMSRAWNEMLTKIDKI